MSFHESERLPLKRQMLILLLLLADSKTAQKQLNNKPNAL